MQFKKLYHSVAQQTRLTKKYNLQDISLNGHFFYSGAANQAMSLLMVLRGMP
jgi:hypothetical protein